MSTTVTDPTAKTEADVTAFDLDLKAHADMDAFYAAVEPPEDVADQLSEAASELPDNLRRRLLSWGWCDPYDIDLARGQVQRLAMYGDWTWVEDDVRFMERIAPFVRPDSFYIFNTPEGLRGWYFDGESVRLRDVEEVAEFDDDTGEEIEDSREFLWLG